MKDWKFCPRCGAGTRHAGDGEAHVECPACGFTKYDNPLPTTLGLVLESGRLLLLRRAHEPRKGHWDTVGGFLSGAETAEENLVREGLEEESSEYAWFPLTGLPEIAFADGRAAVADLIALTSRTGSA
ncbi:NUDIX domain-containing protein [Amycolatopsis sp. lyj-112]|uniref:NUDIX domain-containing protein n=1 Tax=Amycolatopsis sp. lyj-112 TaxID=2789288 RepID=UPI00397C409C